MLTILLILALLMALGQMCPKAANDTADSGSRNLAGWAISQLNFLER